MSNDDAIVLPRPRAKRKRKKPMPPWLMVWLFFAAYELLLIAWGVLDVAREKDIVPNMLSVAILTASFTVTVWPNLKREWEAWKRDDDE